MLSGDDLLVFGEHQWTLSISHLPRRDPVVAPDAEMEDAAATDQPAAEPTAEMAEGESSTQGRVPLSHTEYELLQAELEKIH